MWAERSSGALDAGENFRLRIQMKQDLTASGILGKNFCLGRKQKRRPENDDRSESTLF